MEEDSKTQTLADYFDQVFAPGSGEEDMLNTATKYTLRLSPAQIKCLSFLNFAKNEIENGKNKQAIEEFIDKYLQFKQYCNSQNFILRIFDFHSLRHYIGSGLNIDVKK